MKKIKDWFQKLTPKQQRGVMVGIVMLVAIIIIAATYQAKISNPDNIVVEEKPKKVINLKINEKDDDLALRISMKNQIEEAQKTKTEELAKQQSEINSLKDIVDALNNQNTVQQNSGQMQSYGDLKLNGVPPSPNSNIENADTQKAPLIINGGITVVSIVVPKKEAPASKDKEKGRLVNFIPAGSILKATLINGMYAPTMGKGKESPYPALLQTWDLAFLPNSVRKDLAGCFVLGEAFGEKSGNFYQFDEVKKHTPQVIICEGYATGASIYEATKIPTISAMDSGNLDKVATLLREKYGADCHITIAADNDHKSEKNVGIEVARKVAEKVGATVIIPQFTDEQMKQGYTDFNDYAKVNGKLKLKETIEKGDEKLIMLQKQKEIER